MTTTEFLQMNTQSEAIKSLRNLERENLLKNSFLMEIKEATNKCLNNNDESIEALLKLIHLQIDGLIQSTSELSNLSCTVSSISEYIDNQ